MKIYLNAVFNHFRALQAWASGNDAKLTLDPRTFEMEIKHRGRYYTMYPTFQARAQGHAVHTTVLNDDVFGFGGWKPYHALRHTHSTDKRLFKSFLMEAGLTTPASVQPMADTAAPDFDYLLKAASGSFGKDISGPFRAGTPLPQGVAIAGKLFAEQFIRGTVLKVWFWGNRPFFAHAHDYPRIEGDGVRTVEQLTRDKVESAGQDWEQYADRELVLAALRFQDADWSSILPAGERRWIDYRYAQRHQPAQGITPITDNALPTLLEKSGDQTARMGTALAALLKKTVPLPIMMTVDGMLDEHGTIWWLEMNTNSIAPPELYPTMLADLFD